MESSSKFVVPDEVLELKLEPEDIPLVMATDDNESIEIHTDQQDLAPSDVQAGDIQVRQVQCIANGEQNGGPVTLRLTFNIEIENVRDRPVRTTVGRQRGLEVTRQKKVQFGPDVFVALSSDDEMQDEEENGEPNVDQKPSLRPSPSKPMKCKNAITAKVQSASASGTGNSSAIRDKKTWYCVACRKEIVRHKSRHLKTESHKRNALFDSNPGSVFIKPTAELWHCSVCNIDYSKKYKREHLTTQQHRKKFEENMRNNNSNAIKLF